MTCLSYGLYSGPSVIHLDDDEDSVHRTELSGPPVAILLRKSKENKK
jgi:hypothetical protein